MADDDIRLYLCEKHFSAATAERWLRRSPQDRGALLKLALGLRLGENQFRDVLDALEDIACRQGSELASVLESGPVASVLARKQGRNEAIKALKQALRRLRFPELSGIETRVSALVKSVKLPPGTSMEFPENLEGEEVSIRLRGGSVAELRTRAAALVEALSRPEVEEIFGLLEGDW